MCGKNYGDGKNFKGDGKTNYYKGKQNANGKYYKGKKKGIRGVEDAPHYGDVELQEDGADWDYDYQGGYEETTIRMPLHQARLAWPPLRRILRPHLPSMCIGSQRR